MAIEEEPSSPNLDDPPSTSAKSGNHSCPSGSSTNSASPSPQGAPSDNPQFKCNICFDVPVDPVVTVCGHMYCWRCLLAWMDHGSAQCPVCKAGVTKSNVIPVYGSGSESSQPHPASKEGQEAEKKRYEADTNNCSSIPNRPRAERPEPRPQESRRHGWHSQGVQFGFFPFGVGVQFGGTGFIGTPSRGPPPSREEQRSQFISTILIVLGILVIFWASFVEPLYYSHPF